ncbi:M15 family metallopeptidase, partial [Escherichia coli]
MSDTTELVDLAVIFPDLEIELKYACADNITGKAIWGFAPISSKSLTLL